MGQDIKLKWMPGQGELEDPELYMNRLVLFPETGVTTLGQLISDAADPCICTSKGNDMKTETDEMKSTCPGCHQELPRRNMVWVDDRYGNPWKFCCKKCEPRISREIASWRFDPSDAGESLEPLD